MYTHICIHTVIHITSCYGAGVGASEGGSFRSSLRSSAYLTRNAPNNHEATIRPTHRLRIRKFRVSTQSDS